jgi:hypothetical protein
VVPAALAGQIYPPADEARSAPPAGMSICLAGAAGTPQSDEIKVEL